MDPPADLFFDPAGQTIKYHRDLLSRFIAWAVGVYLLDLFLRRVRMFDRKKIAKDKSAPRTA